MNKVEMYDPYYVSDPTKPHDFLPRQGRSYGGKFTHKSILTGMGDSNFPIDALYWARYSRGVRNALDQLRGEEYRFSIIPDETVFSWRMLCEVYEVAVTALRAGKTDDEARTAAWEYLQGKQQETEAALTPEGTEPSPIISGGEILYPNSTPSRTMQDDEFQF
jgi:hypothetical protein